jgi:hypothetical protein
MADDKFGIPESLEKALTAKEVVPFVGAGVSRAVEKKEKDSTKDLFLLKRLPGDLKRRLLVLKRSL